MGAAVGTVLAPRPGGAEILRAHIAEETGQHQNFLEWALRVPEPKRGTLNFERYPFQLELYDQVSALALEAVIKKATQLGVSTFLLRWVLYNADVRGLTTLYLFPKRQQMYDFSDARIKPAILGSEYLKSRITSGDVQNKGLKKIGPGLLYCRGSESKDDLQSIDADVLAMDEYDEIRPENIPDAEKRLGASDHGLIRRVGVPDLPGRGLDELYEASDQRSWVVRCERCGHHQPLAYDDNVDEEAEELVCKKCRKGPLDTAQGEWVAKYPSRDVRGYHMSRLIVPGQQMKPLILAHKKTNPSEVKAHFTKDLGLAYAPEEGRLSIDRIKAAQREDIPLDGSAEARTGEIRTMGVDVASTRALNVRISAVSGDGNEVLRRSLYLGLADSFGEVAKLMKKFDVTMCCVDHLPEGRLARALSNQFPGRVFLVSYGNPSQKLVLSIDPDLRTASVRRLEAIDAALDSVRTQRNLLPNQLPENYVRDMQNFVRVLEEDEWGKKKVTYRELGPTDWAQCEIYDLVAFDVWQGLTAIEAGEQAETTQLDEHLQFERAQLEVEDPEEYRPGFEDEGKGYGEGEDEFGV